MGVATEISYSTSTAFYLQDGLAGKGWNTKLPFPIHVVKTISTRDEASRNVFTKDLLTTMASSTLARASSGGSVWSSNWTAMTWPPSPA